MIRLEHVSKVYGGAESVRAVDDVTLEVARGELCVLIGPSGSGKTTTMRMINRLEEPSRGRILVNGEDVTSLDPVVLRRGIGYVIQQGGLFPHLDVAANVAFVPRLLGWPPDRQRARAHELLELVGLPPDRFANRYPRQLSGGQQQRVGVARALAADPPIVLMDEPFAAVDPVTRKQLQRELRRIQAEVRKTIVFVTHDIGEAFLLGDRVVLMKDGKVAQNATPADLLHRPASPFVTDFIGEDRAVQSLQHTTLAQLAGPLQRAQRPPRGQPLPGDLSVLDGLRALGLRGEVPDEDGFGISDRDGQLVGFLAHRDLVCALAETLAPERSDMEQPHAVPAR